jgi:hypothetical protein
MNLKVRGLPNTSSRKEYKSNGKRSRAREGKRSEPLQVALINYFVIPILIWEFVTDPIFFCRIPFYLQAVHVRLANGVNKMAWFKA